MNGPELITFFSRQRRQRTRQHEQTSVWSVERDGGGIACTRIYLRNSI